MEDLAYYSSFILNFTLLIVVVFSFRLRVAENIQPVKKAKNWFSFTYLIVSMIIAIFGYAGVATIYEHFGVELDHGHASIAYVMSG